MLEFANGEQYVGQTVNIVTRMSTHLRGGGSHHSPWRDVVSVSVMNVPLEELDEWERREITRRCADGIRLRNKAQNFGFLGESAFDQVLPVESQVHWATGGGDFGLEQYRAAAQRPAGPEPRLFRAEDSLRKRSLDDASSLTIAELIVEALALIIPQVIPDAPRLEARYWTVSDYPGTADGRFATLTVGHLELAIFPRMSFFEENCDTVMLNLPAGTLLTGDRPADGSHDSGDFAESQFPDGSPCWVAPGSYGVTDTDLVAAPVLDLISKEPLINVPFVA